MVKFGKWGVAYIRFGANYAFGFGTRAFVERVRAEAEIELMRRGGYPDGFSS